jgi:hypothetical protein
MQSSGWATPPINYITQRGTFQHGETVKDYFLQPRTIQLLIDQSFCGREEQWDGRAALLNAIRPNRQLTATGVTPGTLRRILPDGSIRDLKAFISDGPAFDPDLGDGWQSYSFKEVLRFIAHDPVIYDPTVQSYVEDFAEASHNLTIPINNIFDEMLVVYVNPNWLGFAPTSNIIVGYANAGSTKYGVGLKFNNVTIPSGSAIVSAHITGQANTVFNTDTAMSRITGNKEINPSPFSTLANYQTRRGTVVGGVDDLKITTAQVDWDAIPHFVGGTWYDSPDISTVVQELINQTGWLSGQSLALFWDDHDDRSTHVDGCYRIFYSAISSAPELHIEYTTSGKLFITYVGTWLSYPKIIITGPLNDAVITHQETGEKLQLDYNIPAGRIVTIDLAYGVKTVKDDLGVNLIGVLSSDSDLATFHIAPDPEVTGGLNHISVVGTGEAVGTTQVEVQFLNRYFGI